MVSADSAVKVEHVSKEFRLNADGARTLKERFFAGRTPTSTFNALTDVHFDVPIGHTVGLLGHNGSGKSTLLKCIAGTITPTAGRCLTRGSMSALLELGAGFHPDLTGRENIYLNGSILGFSKTHIDRIFDDIVEFSEIPEFIDSQVKHYSSGMFARLGFAVAVNLEPDILLIDEVLAVGDEAFQRKCSERIHQFQSDGRTILLVTHSPEQVRQICHSAVVLDRGNMLFSGDCGDAVRLYRDALDRDEQQRQVSGTNHLENTSVLTINDVSIEKDAAKGGVTTGQDVCFTVSYSAVEPVQGALIRFRLTSHDGMVLYNGSTRDVLGSDLDFPAGEGEVSFTLHEVPLLDGRYQLSVEVSDGPESHLYDRVNNGPSFVVSSGTSLGGKVRLDVSAHQPASPAVATTE